MMNNNKINFNLFTKQGCYLHQILFMFLGKKKNKTKTKHQVQWKKSFYKKISL